MYGGGRFLVPEGIFSLGPHLVERLGSSPESPYTGTNPQRELHPNASPPDTLISSFQHMNLGGGTNIQTPELPRVEAHPQQQCAGVGGTLAGEGGRISVLSQGRDGS